MFDRTTNKNTQQLDGLVVTGENLTVTINPPSGPLLIDGKPPLINGTSRDGLDYLADSVQYEVTATAPDHLSSVQFSAPVHLTGPVTGL